MTSSTTHSYWGYRIDVNEIEFFCSELRDFQRLRQGWGWDNGQDLRIQRVDEGAFKNLRIFNEVKRGDVLLVPRLPEWDNVAIVEASADWNAAYDFQISPEKGDYGHIFPARYIKCFNRDSKHVTANIRSTLKARNRFWNISHHYTDIQKLLDADENELVYGVTNENRLTSYAQK